MPSDADGVIELDWPRVRRLGFYVFCAFVTVNAVIAIGALLGDYGREWEIVSSSGVLSLGLLGLLANAPTLERGRGWPLAIVGIASIGLWSGMLVYAIWDDFRTGESFEDVMWGALFIGLGATYVSMLSTVRLTTGQQWIRIVADLVATLAVLLSISALADRSADLATPIGICVVVAVALAVVLPVMGRLNRAEHTTVLVAVDCPMCGVALHDEQPALHQRCTSCGTAFTVELVSRPSEPVLLESDGGRP